MKTFIQTTILAGLLLAGAGCIMGPRYGDQEQYNRGRWHGWADNQGVNQRSQQLLAIEKLRVQPVLTGTMTSTGVVANATSPVPSGETALAGYEGIVANNSPYRTYNFIIRNIRVPESGTSFYLAPGQRAPKSLSYLLPGRYMATIDIDGRQIGQPYIFDVGPRKVFYLDREVHWYVAAGRER